VISTASLHAELQRRMGKLGELVAQRDKLSAQIAELESALGKPAAVAAAPKAARRGRRPKAAKAAKPLVRKRKSYPLTADQFVGKLVAGKGATTAEINKAWKQAGRTGRADNTLNKMFKAGKLKREKLKGQKGSKYTVA
jgi:septal ring factor EnvC (AmiA/AmiB activator)